jgi:hypothetical protein
VFSTLISSQWRLVLTLRVSSALPTDRRLLWSEVRTHLATEGDAEGLGAEDGELAERDEGGVDGDGELHGKLGRDDGRHDQHARDEQFVPGASERRVWHGATENGP